MQEAVIVSGARTPVGSFGCSLKSVKASDLGATAVKAALERVELPAGEVDEVYFGNVLQSAEAGYAGRLAGLKAGIPDSVPAIAVNRACSSGLEAINLAAQLIKTGEIDVAVAGGTESMSQSPFLLDYTARFDGYKIGDIPMRDTLIEGLTCPVNRYHMGVGAENIQARWEISREDQDELALLSHTRAVEAVQSGRFASQIAPVTDTAATGRSRCGRYGRRAASGYEHGDIGEASSRLQAGWDCDGGERIVDQRRGGGGRHHVGGEGTVAGD